MIFFDIEKLTREEQVAVAKEAMETAVFKVYKLDPETVPFRVEIEMEAEEVFDRFLRSDWALARFVEVEEWFRAEGVSHEVFFRFTDPDQPRDLFLKAYVATNTADDLIKRYNLKEY